MRQSALRYKALHHPHLWPPPEVWQSDPRLTAVCPLWTHGCPAAPCSTNQPRSATWVSRGCAWPALRPGDACRLQPCPLQRTTARQEGHACPSRLASADSNRGPFYCAPVGGGGGRPTTVSASGRSVNSADTRLSGFVRESRIGNAGAGAGGYGLRCQ
jgi:hypothetical protein